MSHSILKPTVKRGLMLDFIPNEILASAFDNNRVSKLNDKDIVNGDIVYVMSRELRLEDNWAVVFACELAKKYKKNFKIIIILDNYSLHQLGFMLKGLSSLKKKLAQNGLDYAISEQIPREAGAVIFDFNPINLMEDYAKTLNCAAFEVDSHNIVPARLISNKQEFSAATLRRKVYENIADYLTKYPSIFKVDKSDAQIKLDEFINYKLDSYAEFKNDPNKDFTSNMSPHMHFGFISSQRIAIEILKSRASRANKEAYLEELIVRKELADNFCLYSESFKTLNGIPNWAKATLSAHRGDLRTYIYDVNEFELGKTHDELWNTIQLNLLNTGKIHGYLRMYWAKKILEWSQSPESALQIAIYLNDKYALDGNDPNGYVGILWSIGGIHDRAFTNRMVTGKIRYMSLDGCKRKFDVKEYIAK